MKCRHCGQEPRHVFADLATAPPSNAYLSKADLRKPEKYYPLRVLVCDTCWLVQTEDYASAAELFPDDYAYFSSTSRTWLEHSKAYVETMAARFGLGPQSCVVEVAANDGYLLQFVRERGIPCYGIEPTHQTALAARAKGIEIIEEFFGERLALSLTKDGRQADLVVANNVLAHVPDINDFVTGFATLLKEDGAATFEFPHVPRLVAEGQFDTIYHEHYSYLSLTAVERIFSANGLRIFDVEELPMHGGSLRVFAQRRDAGRRPASPAVRNLLAREAKAGLNTLAYYQGFQAKADAIKNEFLAYLLNAKAKGLKVAGYGAAAKGNTLLNYAGVRGDLLAYVADQAESKQGKFLPGSRIPIVGEAHLRNDRPDRVVILPWNLKEEVMGQLSYIQDWGGRFVFAIPRLTETEERKSVLNPGV
jgi:SAM-dependent methyltransferase